MTFFNEKNSVVIVEIEDPKPSSFELLQKLDDTELIQVHLLAIEDFSDKVRQLCVENKASLSGALAYFNSFQTFFELLPKK